jgi:hypothetical protein
VHDHLRSILRQLRLSGLAGSLDVHPQQAQPSASAILDRFLHHAKIITLQGRSYRLRNRLATAPDAGAGAHWPAILANRLENVYGMEIVGTIFLHETRF